jgi:hypothetical protein
MLVIIFLVLIIFSCSVYVGDCISCTDCLVFFCLCWWLYFLSWLSCLLLPMLVIVFVVLITLSCFPYAGDCISCPNCLVLFCLCWWLYFLSWLSCLVLPVLVIVFLVLLVLSFSAYVGNYISCPDCLVLFCLYNHQHRQNKTEQSGQEIQSPTKTEQDKTIRTRNTIINIGRTRQDN